MKEIYKFLEKIVEVGVIVVKDKICISSGNYKDSHYGKDQKEKFRIRNMRRDST